MRDEDIRRILIERKRKERKQMKRAAVLDAAAGIAAWSSLFALCFMMSFIG